MQLRGQKRKKEKLTEAGYYSWQEKIMNGHCVSLHSSSPFLSGHTCQIFVGGNSHQSVVDCFSFHSSRGQEEEKRNSWSWSAKTFTFDALDQDSPDSHTSTHS